MNKQTLMTISQLSKICSTSRATLLRMEQDGILTPVYQNPENGYRYYDDTSVLRVNMNLCLHEAGISHKEIQEYYHSKDNSHQILQKLETRLHTLEYHVANLRLQINQPTRMSILPFTFPAVDCYVKQVSHVKDSSMLTQLITETLQEVIEKGYPLNRYVSLFEVFDFEKQALNALQEIGYEYTICIPLNASLKSRDIVHFPTQEMLSVKLFGGPSDIVDAISALKKYASQNQISLGNKVRVIGVINSFPSLNAENDTWVTQVCMPIASPNE